MTPKVVADTRLDWRVLLIVLIWLPAAWVNVEPFRGCHIDTWCYLGPAAFATRPFALTMPMLGGWEHADQGWAIHWPGSPLIMSLILPWFGSHVMVVAAICFTFFWLLLAEAARRLAIHATGSRTVGLVALVLILTDRLAYENSAMQRPEMLTALVLVATVGLFYWRFGPGPQAPRWVGPLLLVGLFVMPVMHPVTFLLGACVGVSLLGMAAVEPADRKLLLAGAGALLLGAMVLPVWVLSQPSGVEMFLDHARYNATVQWKMPQIAAVGVAYGLKVFGAVGVLAFFFIALGLGEAVWIWWQRLGQVSREAAPGVPRWRAWAVAVPGILRREPVPGFAAVTLALMIFTQLFHNFFYYVVPLIWITAMALRPIYRVIARLTGLRRALAVACGLSLIVVQAGMLLQRTILYVAHDCPNFPARIAAFVDRLPRQGRLMLPCSLWETGLTQRDRPDGVRMISAPYNLDPKRRRDYEHTTWMQLKPGDMAIIDRFKEEDYRWILEQYGQWEEIDEIKDDMDWYDEFHIDYVVLRLVRLYPDAPLKPIIYQPYSK